MIGAARQLLDLLPRRADYAGHRSAWPRDLAAGVTVGIVACRWPSPSAS